MQKFIKFQRIFKTLIYLNITSITFVEYLKPEIMTKDKITLDRIQLMHPDLRTEVSALNDLFFNALTGRAICRFAYTLRTYKEQDDLFAIGRKAGTKK